MIGKSSREKQGSQKPSKECDPGLAALPGRPGRSVAGFGVGCGDMCSLLK
jgi:hypothetical protein